MSEEAGVVRCFFLLYQILVVIKAQNVKVAWRPPNYCNVSSQRNNLIKLTHFDETEKPAQLLTDKSFNKNPC